jgi:Flp pilus assembly CpaE family ATPase
MVLVVLTPELNAVRSTIRLLTTGSDIGLRDKVRLILNRSDSGLGLDQLNAVLPNPIDAMIPSDGRLFVASVNSGKTILEMDSARGAPARRAIESLVDTIAAYGKGTPPKRSNTVLARLANLAGRRKSSPSDPTAQLRASINSRSS